MVIDTLGPVVGETNIHQPTNLRREGEGRGLDLLVQSDLFQSENVT